LCWLFWHQFPSDSFEIAAKEYVEKPRRAGQRELTPTKIERVLGFAPPVQFAVRLDGPDTPGWAAEIGRFAVDGEEELPVEQFTGESRGREWIAQRPRTRVAKSKVSCNPVCIGSPKVLLTIFLKR